MIRGRGYAAAKVMLVADGGAESDSIQELALTGNAETKLRALAKSQSLNFDEFWLTCLIKEKITNKSGRGTYEENKKLLTLEYGEILSNEIKTINPNVICPLGEISFNYLSGLNGIRKFRGSILPAQSHLATGSRIIPILGPHPYLYEDPKLEFISRLDFDKVRRNQNEQGPIIEKGTCWIAKTPGEVRSYFRRHTGASFVVFDIETFANIPTCISFCFDGMESCCVPLLDYHITEDDRVLMLLTVAELLRSPIPKVNQNVKFDWRKLEKWGLTVSNVIGDTMIAANCLYCEFPKNLGFLTSIYTDMPYFKDEGKDYDPASYDRNKLYIYNAKDSLATYQIHVQQQEELQETGTKAVYELQMGILSTYKRMEEYGIRVDNETCNRLLCKYESLYETYKYKLQRLVGRDINPLSSVVCQRLVYEELNYKPVRGTKHTTTGKPSADEESLELLLWMGNSPSYNCRDILRTIIDCRKLHKVIELLVLPIYPDGRFRCEFNLAGTVNGRSSAGECTDYMLYLQDNGVVKMSNIGHSFQTIGKHGFEVDGETYGKDIRSMFVPSSGYIFVECDLSQAEARVDAVLASDYNILGMFDGTVGIHKLTGSWVFDCEPLDIKKNILVEGVDRYHVAKTVRHAGERNMQHDRLMMMIHQPVETCIKILKKFHDNQPNIRGVFHKEIRDKVTKERLLVAPNGRRRQFFGRIDEHTINEAISFLPQAIVTDYLKQSLTKTMGECPWAHPLVEAHDGFLAEVPKGREEEYGTWFVKNVEVDIDFRTCSLSRDFKLRIPAEVSIGEDWENMREIKI